MKIAGDYLIAAPRDTVWEAILDPEVLSRTLPGFEQLERTGDNEFEGALNIRVGPVQGQFQGRVQLSDLDPPAGYRLKLGGKGAPGFVDGEGSLRLEEEEGSTRLFYDIDAQVGGRIAGVGQRLLDSSAKVLTRQALEGLETQLRARAAPATGIEGEPVRAVAAAPPTPGPPSQAAFAARFARDLARELVPPERRPLVFAAGLVLYTVIVVLITRACGG